MFVICSANKLDKTCENQPLALIFQVYYIIVWSQIAIRADSYSTAQLSGSSVPLSEAMVLGHGVVASIEARSALTISFSLFTARSIMLPPAIALPLEHRNDPSDSCWMQQRPRATVCRS